MRFFLYCCVFCVLSLTQAQDYPFSLVNLKMDSTTIVLKDYFPLYKQLKVESVPNGISYKLLSNNRLQLIGVPHKMVDGLQLNVDGKNQTLVLKKSRKIKYTFQFKSDKKYNQLKIKGSFNSWNVNAHPLTYKNGAYTFTSYFNPGKYEYVLVDGKKEFFDPTNPQKVGNGIGGINSVLQVGDTQKAPPFIYTYQYNSRSNQILIHYNQKDLDFIVLYNNQIISDNHLTTSSRNGDYFLTIQIPKQKTESKRNYLSVFGFSQDQTSNDVLIPLENNIPVQNTNQLDRTDFQSNIMYSVMVDRFFNKDKSNDHPLNRKDIVPLADWKGGDLKGILQKIKDGYFTNLGINSIWISPIVQNPKKPYGHMKEFGIDTKFTGYHGYWPTSSSKIDERFGTADDLNQIIKIAHEKGINILLDYVANHVHIEHPLVKEHPDWITQYKLSDGRKNERLYDEYRLTTWFDEFLPTLDLENPKVVDAMTDSAIYWFKKYPIDGFRHDATKHIPNEFWRTLSYKLKTKVAIPQNRQLYQIGETYGGHELVSSYVNTGMLNAQFEFSLYHHLSHALMEKDYSMLNLKTALEDALFYYGSHNLMGNISGNHDKGRIISYADGNLSFNESAKEAGYTRDISNQNGEIGYKKVAQLMAFNLFVPGIPVIYYGDEIGMPGGDDPDNRRIMEFNGYNTNQTWLKNTVKRLTQLRHSRMELLYGDTKTLFADDKSIVLLRTYLGKSSVLVLNKSEQPKKLNIEMPKSINTSHAKANFETSFSIQNNWLEIEIQASGFELINID